MPNISTQSDGVGTDGVSAGRTGPVAAVTRRWGRRGPARLCMDASRGPYHAAGSARVVRIRLRRPVRPGRLRPPPPVNYTRETWRGQASGPMESWLYSLRSERG